MESDHSINERLEKYLNQEPTIGNEVYIARSAVVFGAVTLGKQSSVWYNAVLRGDIHEIVVGEGTNIQDNAVLHIADDFGCYIGDYVTVGHSVWCTPAVSVMRRLSEWGQQFSMVRWSATSASSGPTLWLSRARKSPMARWL